MTKNEQTFEDLKKLILENPTIFDLPNNYKDSNGYFPDFVKELLNKYEKFFIEKLNDIINNKIPFASGEKDIILNKIKILNTIIFDTLESYYAGKPFKANKIFSQGLEDAFLSDIQYETEVPSLTNFYRAREDNGKIFECTDLFHIDFKLRTQVSTKRYSIPGFPSLYLGDSSYVCWEEFGKPKFRSLWFSRFQNKQNIKIIEILLVEDFLKKVEEIDQYFKFTYILRYLISFPLTLASTIKVKNINDNFKPEYIIPQMLLEYVIGNDEIDGIKFPSTKVKYDSLKEINAYNYVFPVKSNKKEGLCDRLKDLFKLTDPTSLEMEELFNNPVQSPPIYLNNGPLKPEMKIKITEDKELFYFNTSFGKIEYILKSKKLKDL